MKIMKSIGIFDHIFHGREIIGILAVIASEAQSDTAERGKLYMEHLDYLLL